MHGDNNVVKSSTIALLNDIVSWCTNLLLLFELLWLSCPRSLTSVYMYGSLKNPWVCCGDVMESACVRELGRYGSEVVKIHRKQQA